MQTVLPGCCLAAPRQNLSSGRGLAIGKVRQILNERRARFRFVAQRELRRGEISSSDKPSDKYSWSWCSRMSTDC
jgi:hypothetical protein